MRALLLLVILSLFLTAWPASQTPTDKAQQVIEASIGALGGEAFLSARNTQSKGRYFIFNKGRRGFTYYWDWTVFDPIQSRNQLGKGKRQEVTIVNLEINKGWLLEGKEDVSEIPEDVIAGYPDGLKDNLDLLFRKWRHEEGMSFYYYGPDDVAGSGELEAVEFLDATNAAVVVFFQLEDHLPAKIETHYTDSFGVRHKRETEFYNWHVIQGINSPLRIDIYTDEEMTTQFFIEELAYNVEIPPGHFLEPVVENE